ncbi:Btb/poz domain-containing protein, partial [Daphnia magna]
MSRRVREQAKSFKARPLPVPDFQVTDQNDGYFKIEGTFNTTEYETSRQEVKFELNDICPGLFSLHLSYEPVDYETSSSSFEYGVELSLENTSSCFSNISPLVCCEDSHRRPTAVCASINACPTFFLKQISPGQWKSAEMYYESKRFELQQMKIPCVLWIHFSRTTGERNAQ